MGAKSFFKHLILPKLIHCFRDAFGKGLDVPFCALLLPQGVEVFLKGRGTYVINGEPGYWTLEGVRLSLASRTDAE